MSKGDQERARLIKSIRQDILRLERKLSAVLNGCNHKLHKTKTGGSVCRICDKHFGWWCPKSPDKVCHYSTIAGGQVDLVTGEQDHPPDHDAKWESDDHCLYCGQPDERK